MTTLDAARSSAAVIPPEAGPGLYVLRNPSFDHMVKIGMSTAGLRARVSSLINSTAVPFPFDVVALFPTPSKLIAKTSEREVFQRLSHLRASDREYFFANDGPETDDLLELIEEVIAEVSAELGDVDDFEERAVPSTTGKTVEQMVDEVIAIRDQINGGRLRGIPVPEERRRRAGVLAELGYSTTTYPTDAAAEIVGFGEAKKYYKALRVVNAAREMPEVFQTVLDEMNRTGRINRAYEKVRTIRAVLSASLN